MYRDAEQEGPNNAERLKSLHLLRESGDDVLLLKVAETHLCVCVCVCVCVCECSSVLAVVGVVNSEYKLSVSLLYVVRAASIIGSARSVCVLVCVNVCVCRVSVSNPPVRQWNTAHEVMTPHRPAQGVKIYICFYPFSEGEAL